MLYVPHLLSTKCVQTVSILIIGYRNNLPLFKTLQFQGRHATFEIINRFLSITIS